MKSIYPFKVIYVPLVFTLRMFYILLTLRIFRMILTIHNMQRTIHSDFPKLPQPVDLSVAQYKIRDSHSNDYEECCTIFWEVTTSILN
jgi:hypothetical protein